MRQFEHLLQLDVEI